MKDFHLFYFILFAYYLIEEAMRFDRQSQKTIFELKIIQRISLFIVTTLSFALYLSYVVLGIDGFVKDFLSLNYTISFNT